MNQITMNTAEAAQIIAEAPSYTEWTLEWMRGEEIKTVRLMARDLPRAGRRCTCLTTGFEWFDITAESLQDMGFVALLQG